MQDGLWNSRKAKAFGSKLQNPADCDLARLHYDRVMTLTPKPNVDAALWPKTIKLLREDYSGLEIEKTLAFAWADKEWLQKLADLNKVRKPFGREGLWRFEICFQAMKKSAIRQAEKTSHRLESVKNEFPQLDRFDSDVAASLWKVFVEGLPSPGFDSGKRESYYGLVNKLARFMDDLVVNFHWNFSKIDSLEQERSFISWVAGKTESMNYINSDMLKDFFEEWLEISSLAGATGKVIRVARCVNGVMDELREDIGWRDRLADFLDEESKD